MFYPLSRKKKKLIFLIQIFIKLNHPIIFFLTDDISNKDQELICITSEVIFGIRNDKISLIKDKIIKFNRF